LKLLAVDDHNSNGWCAAPRLSVSIASVYELKYAGILPPDVLGAQFLRSVHGLQIFLREANPIRCRIRIYPQISLRSGSLKVRSRTNPLRS
jgi:hypothetical protein